MKTLKNLLRSGLFIAAFLTFAGIAHATDFIVDTTTTDEGSGDCLTGTSGTCTIHRAINLATLASEGPNRIIFSSSISGQTISGFSSPALISGDTQELTIDGEENNITMSGTNGPILSISNTASNITIQNINFDNGGRDWFGMGGAGSITVSSPDTGTTVTIQNNGFTHSTCPADGTRFRTAVYATPSTNPYNIEVLNNTFSGYNAFTTEASNATFTVTGNEIDSNCSTLAIYARAGKGTISDNDISINGTISLEGLMSAITYNNALPPPEFPSETGTVEISNNTITSDESEYIAQGVGIRDINRSLSFNITGNEMLPGSGEISGGIQIDSGANISITENRITLGDEGGFGINLSGFSNGIITSSEINDITIEHNTVYGPGTVTAENGVGMGSSPAELSITNITIKYNIFNTFIGVYTGWDVEHSPTITNFIEDYNLSFDNGNREEGFSVLSYIGLEAGEHDTASISPGFADPDNYDYSLLPFSYAIGFCNDEIEDENNNDAGAINYDGTRRTTIYVDDDGEINHDAGESSVDFNDIQSAVNMAADDDTVLVAGGIYNEYVTINSKSITLTGSDDPLNPSIIDATGEGEGLTFESADNSTVSNFTIRNVGMPGIFPSIHGYTYGINTYDGSVVDDEPVRAFIVVTQNSETPDPETDMLQFATNEGTDAESCTTCLSNWHLGLVDLSIEGETGYLPMYFVGSEFENQTEAQTWIENLEGTIAFWYENAFIYNEETNAFTFNSNVINGTGASLIEDTIPVVLTSQGAGVFFENSSNNTISNTNVSSSIMGIYFRENSLANVIIDMIFSEIGFCNVFSEVDDINTVNGEEIGLELCAEDIPPLDSDITAPVGLTALTLRSRTSSSVTLNWSQVTEENFDHYEIWYGTNLTEVENQDGLPDACADGCITDLEPGSAINISDYSNPSLATITTTSATITGLSSSTQYYFKIWAVDTSGNEETVATLSVTTSSNGGGSSSVITTPAPTPESTPDTADNDAADITDSITDIADTVVTITETVRDEQITEQENEQNAQEATELISNLISEILTADLVDEIIDLDADVENETDEDPSSPYTPEDLAILTDPNEDIDGDGISNAEEIARGTDPLVNNSGTIDELFTKPLEDKEINSGVGALKVLGVGDESFVVSGSTTPGSEIEITMTNSKGHKVTLKTTADVNGNYILPVTLTDQLIDGSLLIKATNEDGKKDVVLAKFKESTLKKPTLAFEGEKVIQYEDLTLRELIALIKASQEYKTSWAKDLNLHQLSSLLGSPIEKKVAFTLEKTDLKSIEGGKIIVKGKATPGSTVVLAYKSVIYSSIVIADKNGNFTAELPKDLQGELAKDPNSTDALHEFIVFAMDYKKNEASAFNKGQFKLLK